jgi:hypothetical protein
MSAQCNYEAYVQLVRRRHFGTLVDPLADVHLRPGKVVGIIYAFHRMHDGVRAHRHLRLISLVHWADRSAQEKGKGEQDGVHA